MRDIGLQFCLPVRSLFDFDIQGNAGLIKLVWEMSLHFYFLEEFVFSWYYFFLKSLIEFNTEDSEPVVGSFSSLSLFLSFILLCFVLFYFVSFFGECRVRKKGSIYIMNSVYFLDILVLNQRWFCPSSRRHLLTSGDILGYCNWVMLLAIGRYSENHTIHRTISSHRVIQTKMSIELRLRNWCRAI